MSLLCVISLILTPSLKDIHAVDEENEVRETDAAHIPTARRGVWGVDSGLGSVLPKVLAPGKRRLQQIWLCCQLDASHACLSVWLRVGIASIPAPEGRALSQAMPLDSSAQPITGPENHLNRYLGWQRQTHDFQAKAFLEPGREDTSAGLVQVLGRPLSRCLLASCV